MGDRRTKNPYYRFFLTLVLISGNSPLDTATRNLFGLGQQHLLHDLFAGYIGHHQPWSGHDPDDR